MWGDVLGGLALVFGVSAVLTGVFGGRVLSEWLLRWYYRRTFGLDELDAEVTAELVAAGYIPAPRRRRPARPLPPAGRRGLFPRGGAS
jgi:hypothetical protein